jgi:hypothetical protein
MFTHDVREHILNLFHFLLINKADQQKIEIRSVSELLVQKSCFISNFLIFLE